MELESCSFSPRGNNLENCIQMCNEETNGLCQDYCSNSCSNCSDKRSCLWLNTTTTKPTTTGSPMYNQNQLDALISRMTEYNRFSNMLLDVEDEETNDMIEQLQTIKDHKTRRDIIFNYLISMYDLNTELLLEGYEETKKSGSNVSDKNKAIAKNKRISKELKEELKKKDRQYKLNMGAYNKMIFETQTLQYLFYYVALLLAIPLIYLMELVPKMLAFVVWLVLIALGFSYGMYRVASNNKNRDEMFYDKYNFNKPTNENLLRSALDQKLNPVCQTPLDADKNDFEPQEVDMDVSAYMNN